MGGRLVCCFELRQCASGVQMRCLVMCCWMLGCLSFQVKAWMLFQRSCKQSPLLWLSMRTGHHLPEWQALMASYQWACACALPALKMFSFLCISYLLCHDWVILPCALRKDSSHDNLHH